MRGKYRKKREEKLAPKKKIWPVILKALLLLYLIAAVIGTAVIYTGSGELSLVGSFLQFLENTVVAIILILFVILAFVFLDIVGRFTHFLLGDGFGDPGDGIVGGGGSGSGGGGGSFGGGGASR